MKKLLSRWLGVRVRLINSQLCPLELCPCIDYIYLASKHFISMVLRKTSQAPSTLLLCYQIILYHASLI